MTKKPILTEEQLQAKADEFNNIPKDDRLLGMPFSLDCELTRILLIHAWNTAKEYSEKEGFTDIESIFLSCVTAFIGTMLERIGAPTAVVHTLALILLESDCIKGMIWHVLSDTIPEDDLVLLTGNFDVYSEVSNG